MSPGTKQTILFVDDEKSWRDQVSASLTEAGYAVLSAVDGSEAMHKAADASLDMMIVDEDLAGESGVMLTRFLRRNHPDVPTLLYTTNRLDPREVPDIRQQVADRCLPKGNMTDLIANVAYYAK
jgi:DNA-binding response OmpR family regulator